MHGAISHHTIGIRRRPPVRAPSVVPEHAALLVLAGGLPAGRTGAASFCIASPSPDASSLAWPPPDRAPPNLVSLPSSRNWAIQAVISCSVTSAGEILTFINKPSLRYAAGRRPPDTRTAT